MGTESPHATTSDRLSVVQMDVAFVGTKQESYALQANDIRTHVAMARIVPSESVNRYSLTELERSIHDAGHFFGWTMSVP